MRLSLILLFPLLITLLSSCDGDYRQRAIGDNVVVTVVMDSALHESETAQALRDTFESVLVTIPGRPYLYELNFQEFTTNDQLEQLQKQKNLVFAAPLEGDGPVSQFIRQLLSEEVENRVLSGESFAFPLEDQWYRNQRALILTSTDDSELADKIRNTQEPLTNIFVEVELERWKESIFERAEQTEISDSLWIDHGWKVRMQHDYIQTVDTTNVVMFNRYLPNNNRIMWAWWSDEFENPDMIDPQWINTKRDSLMQIYMRGDREDSWVVTDLRRGNVTTPVERDDRILGWETMGNWEMTADAMGGPFVNFTYYDPATSRVFMIEYWQFAPDISKRRFVFQFRAMGRTFEADSTFTPGDSSSDSSLTLRESSVAGS